MVMQKFNSHYAPSYRVLRCAMDKALADHLTLLGQFLQQSASILLFCFSQVKLAHAILQSLKHNQTLKDSTLPASKIILQKKVWIKMIKFSFGFRPYHYYRFVESFHICLFNNRLREETWPFDIPFWTCRVI